MANKGTGFAAIYRSLLDHWIWTSDTPFDDRSAWIDLILNANHEDRQIKVGQNVITIHAGQKWTSYVKLANRWKWSRERVYRYIKMLKKEGMVYVDATPNGTLLTLVNYEKFTVNGNANETTTKTTGKTSSKTSGETSTETQTTMNNNVNNEEQINKKDPAPPKGGGEWQ